MKCTFGHDQKEYCPLEHFNKGNTHWKLNTSEDSLKLSEFVSNFKQGKLELYAYKNNINSI